MQVSARHIAQWHSICTAKCKVVCLIPSIKTNKQKSAASKDIYENETISWKVKENVFKIHILHQSLFHYSDTTSNIFSLKEKFNLAHDIRGFGPWVQGGNFMVERYGGVKILSSWGQEAEQGNRDERKGPGTRRRPPGHGSMTHLDKEVCLINSHVNFLILIPHLNPIKLAWHSQIINNPLST